MLVGCERTRGADRTTARGGLEQDFERRWWLAGVCSRERRDALAGAWGTGRAVGGGSISVRTAGGHWWFLQAASRQLCYLTSGTMRRSRKS